MTTAVVMTIEGVLIEGQDLKTALPSEHGRLLYETLKAGYQVTLVTRFPEDLVVPWLSKQNITGFGSVMYYAASGLGLELPKWKAHQVRRLLLSQRPVAWFIDVDPEAIQCVFLEGVPTMLLSHPRFIRPDFRPDSQRKVRAWSDLIDTLDREQLFAATQGDT